jgi:hypothetical protein
MSWSPLQREMLEAMGLSPYLLASAMPADDSPRVAAHENTAASAKTAVHTSGQTSSARNPQASSDADALAAALLRAAGRDRAAADRDSVLQACPPPLTLRGDPRAKRALWPILRAMRRH